MHGVSSRPTGGAHGRAALASLEIMVGVLIAHTWAGGALPDVAWLLGLAALVHAASLLVVTGRAALAPMVLGLGVAQVALHTGLALLEPAAHHGHHAAPTGVAVLDLTWQMAAAHLASAVVTTLVWRVRRRLLDAASAWPGHVPAVLGTPRCVATPGAAPMPRPRLLLLAAPTRGPPMELCRA